jgi:3-oxoacyl-[acyl-carrier-protein] synthase II
MITNSSKRVAITGLGIITAIGESIPTFREALFGGKCGIGPISLFDTTGFPCQVAAQIKNRNLGALFKPKEIRRFSRCDLLGLIAAQEALLDSNLDLEGYTKSNIGVVLGAGAGGMLSWEKYRRTLWLKKTKPTPSLLLPIPHCTLTDLIASRYKMTGFRATISTACSSSATSIGYGFDLIRSGVQDIVATGGSESLSELTFAGFNSLRLMDPEYCRPFDKIRRGLSLGEAGVQPFTQKCLAMPLIRMPFI